MPFFSVIIPVFNKGNFIEKTLKSVLAQTYADFEVIIVNDGSTDASEKKILEFTDSRIRYFFKENEGVSIARNFGIEKSESDFICFLDADDYWYPTFLETANTYIRKLPAQKVFGIAYENETAKSIFPAQYSISRTNDFEIVDYFEASKKESALWTSSAVFHKEVFTKAGNFDAAIKSGQDIDLWIRIGLTYPIVFIWKIEARYVFDAESLSRNKTYLNKKFDFSKFEPAEKNNQKLKSYLDLNRFSLAIKSKLIHDDKSFREYYNAIDLEKLPLRKRILLRQPAFILKILISVKLLLANLGLGNSVFR